MSYHIYHTHIIYHVISYDQSQESGTKSDVSFFKTASSDTTSRNKDNEQLQLQQVETKITHTHAPRNLRTNSRSRTTTYHYLSCVAFNDPIWEKMDKGHNLIFNIFYSSLFTFSSGAIV